MNVLTQAAALVAVRSRDAYAPVVEQIRSERERLHAGIEALISATSAAGRVWPGQGNFLLVRLPDAARLRERLRDEYSILVRDFSSAPGLAGCLRITVGTPEENDAVLSALAELLKGDES